MNRIHASLTAGALIAALCTAALAQPASAQPTANGNIDDIITFGQGLTVATGCFLDASDDKKPICTDGTKIPCGTVENIGTGRYWANGFDITRGVMAYDDVNNNLYLGVRTAGEFVRPLSEHDTVIRHHARADNRVRRRPAETAACVLDRPPHPPRVVGRGYRP